MSYDSNFIRLQATTQYSIVLQSKVEDWMTASMLDISGENAWKDTIHRQAGPQGDGEIEETTTQYSYSGR